MASGSDDQEPTAIGTVGHSGVGRFGLDHVDLGRRQLEMAALALLADERSDRHTERGTIAIVRGQDAVIEEAAELAATFGEVGELTVDVAHLDGQRVVGLTESFAILLLAQQMSSQLIVEGRLRFELLHLVEIDFFDLSVDRVRLVHQGLGLPRGDDGLHLTFEALTVRQQVGAALLSLLDREAQLVDLGPHRRPLLLPRAHHRSRVGEIVTQRRMLATVAELVSLGVDGLQPQEDGRNGGWRVGR